MVTEDVGAEVVVEVDDVDPVAARLVTGSTVVEVATVVEQPGVDQLELTIAGSACPDVVVQVDRDVC